MRKELRDRLDSLRVIGAVLTAFDNGQKVSVYIRGKDIRAMLRSLNEVKSSKETNDWEDKYKDLLEENELLARENKALEDDNYQKCELNEKLAKENKQLLERVKRLEERC